jgi:hypothetical protein
LTFGLYRTLSLDYVELIRVVSLKAISRELRAIHQLFSSLTIIKARVEILQGGGGRELEP